MPPCLLALMKRKPVAKGRKESKQRKLPEFKVLGDRILNKRDIKGIDPAVNVIKIERKGVIKACLVCKEIIYTQIKPVIVRKWKTIPFAVVNSDLRKEGSRIEKFTFSQGYPNPGAK